MVAEFCVIVVFYGLGVYSGVLLARMAAEFRNQARTFGGLGDIFFNKYGALFCYVSVYLYIALILCEYLLVLGKSFQGMLDEQRLCIAPACLP
eukprot:UN12064